MDFDIHIHSLDRIRFPFLVESGWFATAGIQALEFDDLLAALRLRRLAWSIGMAIRIDNRLGTSRGIHWKPRPGRLRQPFLQLYLTDDLCNPAARSRLISGQPKSCSINESSFREVSKQLRMRSCFNHL